MDIVDFRRELHAWLDEHHDEVAPPYARAGNARRAHRADATREGRSSTRRAGCGGVGPSTSAASAARRCCAPSSARRWPARDLADPGLFSLVEVLAPTLIDFAPPELAAEVVPRLLSGDGDVVPGLLRARHRQRPLGPELPRRTRRRPRDRDDVGHQRPEGVDQPRAVLGAVRAAHAHRAAPSRATAASPRSSSTWTRRASRSRRSR